MTSVKTLISLHTKIFFLISFCYWIGKIIVHRCWEVLFHNFVQFYICTTLCDEGVYFNKGREKFHLHHTLKAYKEHEGRGVKIYTLSYPNFTGNKILNFCSFYSFLVSSRKKLFCCWELYLRRPVPTKRQL